MRIGVDSRPLRESQTSGIPMYVRSLLKSLASLDDQNEYVLYAHKDFDFNLPNPRWSKRSGALTRYGSVWMQAELPLWLERDKIDLFWGTQHILPLLMSNKIKAVLTVHDLIHYVFPKTMRPMNLIINKLIIPPSIHRTDAVVAMSEWTMKDVKKYLNPKLKILDVIYEGVDKKFYQRDRVSCKKKVKDLFNLPDQFFLTVGTFEPRKNIAGIFQALSLIGHRIPHHLVVVGQSGWKNKSTLENIYKSSLKDRIHMLGYVPDVILPDVYSAADLFVFPSLYEGFGLPPLEAMACGVPVVASNVSSIPEVVGEAALLVDPYSVRDIADGIYRALQDESLRRDLIDKGLKRAAQFSWEATAKKMLKVFNLLNEQR